MPSSSSQLPFSGVNKKIITRIGKGQAATPAEGRIGLISLSRLRTERRGLNYTNSGSTARLTALKTGLAKWSPHPCAVTGTELRKETPESLSLSNPKIHSLLLFGFRFFFPFWTSAGRGFNLVDVLVGDVY